MTAQLFFLPYQVATVSGIAQPGASITFCTTETTTPEPIYSDSALSVPLTNPVTANGAGRFVDIYLDASVVYRVIVKSAAGTTLDDIDPYNPGTIDIPVSLAAGSVALSKLADIATNKLLGRATAGSGAVEQIDLTAAGRALIDDASAAAQRVTLDVPSTTDLANAIATIAAGNPTLSGFVSGGQAVWVSGFQYKVTAASYYINGTLYSSAEQSITLDAADGTFDRIDVLALDNTGTLVKITGTAAAAPSEPDIDPGTQIEVTFVTVATGTTAPATAANESIYLEGVEWTTTVTGTHITKDSTNNPRTGTKDIEATSAVTGDSLLFDKGSTIIPSNYTALVLYIRNKTANWGTTKLRVNFRNAAGSRIGNIISIQNGAFGFSTANTTTYQAVSIPLSLFAISGAALIQKMNIVVNGSTAVGFYIDDLVLQLNGAGSGSTSGLTQTQADARYAQRSANLSDLASATTARTNLGAAASGAATASGLTMATNRLLGRTTASSGALEEISIGSGLALSGGSLSRFGTGTFKGALVKKSADQTGLNSTAGVTLSWNAEEYDTDAFHDTVTNPERLTVPSGLAKVRVSAGVQIASFSGSGYLSLYIQKNGSSDYIGVPEHLWTAASTLGSSVTIGSPALAVTPGDYFSVFLKIETDTSVDILSGRSWFAIEAVE